MNHEIKTNKSKGFSLVELIVVIAIMAVMVAVLAPALLQYVERSRAQKDDSAMGEVSNAIQLALSDQKIYDEVLYSTAKYNYSCYIDKASETDTTLTSLKENIKSDGSEYRFKSDARLADEEKYSFAGKMRGVTITFKNTGTSSNSAEFKLGDGIINAALKSGTSEKIAQNTALGTTAYYGGGDWAGKKLSEIESTTATAAAGLNHHYLYNRVRASVGDSITLTSQTYRNSDYTVFIRMATTGGNSAAGQDSVQVYGQWNGTNLNKDSK